MKNKITYFFLRSKWFLLPYSFIAIIALFSLIAIEKGEEVLMINSVSGEWLDRFFLVVTDIGLGGYVALVAALLFFYNLRWSILLFMSLGWSGILTHLFKRIIFAGETRPLHYFYYADFPRFLHDVPLIYYNSFPSGHTMTIFASCTIIAYLSGRPLIGLIALLLATLVGISRIYLLQHFGIDVFAGSFLGILAALLSVVIIDCILVLNDKSFSGQRLWLFIFKRRN